MKYAPVVPIGVKDQKLTLFLTVAARALGLLPDHQCYTNTVVWTLPFRLLIPSYYGVPRTTQPQIVRLGRAVLDSDPSTVVQWGASTTWVWKGNDTVSILDQAGLVEGVKYQLTWEVIG